MSERADPAHNALLQRAFEVFDAVVELPPQARETAIAEHCGDDAALEAQVRKLLQADAADDGVLAGIPALDALIDDDAPAEDPFLQQRVGVWHLDALLGRGGMGAVYRGHRQDAAFEQQAAVKLIRVGLDSPGARERFGRERQILARLQHPHIATLLDGGVSEQGVPYFAMQYVDGQRIDHWCDAQRLGVRERLTLFSQVLDAVQYAHRNLIVHRDLKPSNVLVDAQGRVKLLDFGIAKLIDAEGDATRTQERALTPEYAAPEQLHGEPITTATDIYQLGVMLHALLSGSHPFGITAQTPLAKQLNALQRAPQVLTEAAALGDAQTLQARATTRPLLVKTLRGDLSAIVATCLAREAEHRYQSVDALHGDIQRWLRGLPVTVRAASRGYRLRKFVRRHRLPVAAGAAVFAALAIGMGVALWQAQQARIERDRALTEAARSKAVREYLQLMFRDTGPAAGAQSIDVRDVLQRGAKQLATRFADDPAGGQATALALAGVYHGLGDAAGADPLIEQVLHWPGVENNADLLAQAWRARAESALLKGDVSGGLAAYERAVAAWRRDPSRYANELNDIQTMQAKLHRKAGNHQQAVDLLQKAVRERRDTLHLVDTDLASMLAELCGSRMLNGDVDNSARDCNEALTIYTQHHMQDSASAMGVRNTLAAIRVKQNRFDQAATLFETLLQAHTALYGKDSPDSAAIEINLSTVLAKLDKLPEAIVHGEHALQVLEKSGAGQSPPALAAHINLGDTFVKKGDLPQAKMHLDKAQVLLEALPPLKPVLGGKLARSQATLAIASGNRPAATAYLQDAERIFQAAGAAGAADLKSVAALRAKLPQ